MKWYRLAADQGYALAQFNLGWMYRNGKGVEQSDEEAVKWYRLAADQGDDGAQNNLGWMYENGKGVDQSDEEAVKWYRLSSDQGNTVARENIIRIQDEGYDVASDDYPNDNNIINSETVDYSTELDSELSTHIREVDDSSVDWSKWHVDVSKLRKTSDDADFVYRMMYPEGLHDDSIEDDRMDPVEVTNENLDFRDEIGHQALEYLRLCMVSSEDALKMVSEMGLDIDLFEDGINEIAYRHFGDTVVDHGCINEDMIETLEEILND